MKKIEGYTELIEYIKEIYIKNAWNVSDIPLPKIGTQLNKIMKENPDYSYSAIQYTIYYMIELEEMEVLKDDSDSFIPLIPFYYINAREFNKKCREIKKLANEFDFTENIRVVKVGNRSKKVEEMEF